MTPTQTPVTHLDDLDRRILKIIEDSRSWSGSWPPVPRIARLAKCTDRTVQRRLRKLEAARVIERIPVFERGDDLEWRARAATGVTGGPPGRQTSNSYRLTPPSEPASVSPAPGDTGYPQFAAHPPVTPVDGVTPTRASHPRYPDGCRGPGRSNAGPGGAGAEFADAAARVRVELWESRLEDVQAVDPAATWDGDRVITLGDGTRLVGAGEVKVYLHHHPITGEGRSA